VPTCDRQTDGQTDGFTMANTALCIASCNNCIDLLCSLALKFDDDDDDEFARTRGATESRTAVVYCVF